MNDFLTVVVTITACVVVLLVVFSLAVAVLGERGLSLPGLAERWTTMTRNLLSPHEQPDHRDVTRSPRPADTTKTAARGLEYAPTLHQPGPSPARWDVVTRRAHLPGRGEMEPAPVPGSTRVFGAYRLHDLLGQGGMGQVWRAYDTRRQRWVALKLLRDDADISSRARERMQREAQLAGSLSCAHVVPVHDFGRIEGVLFLDMRLVAGGDLAALLTRHPQGLGAHHAVEIVAQVAAALDAAHTAGLVHCDVKPSNVLLEHGSTGDFCYLADFGVATLAHARTAASPHDTICGTPSYMAPEAFMGDASIASDVYALGAVAYHLLTGRTPFLGTDLFALYHQHRMDAPPLLESAAASTSAPTALDGVITRALAKDPARRHSSAGELAAALTVALSGAGTAVPNLVLPARGAPTTAAAPPDDSLDAVFEPEDE